MEKIKDLWIDVKYYIEDHRWVRWLTGIGVIATVVIVGASFLGGEDKGEGATESGVESVTEVESTGENVEGVVGVSEETLHILTNPDQYEEDDVNRAYHDSLTTFDDPFVEENTYVDTGLTNGVYLYHEKANEEYAEIANLAKEVSNLGVDVYFYTPQFDQSIASISNHTQVLEGGEVTVLAVIVRDYKVAEEIKDVQEVKSYMEGVIDENTE